MDVLINELSLTGQYSSKKEFIDLALISFIRILKELQSAKNIDLYKSIGLFDCMATCQDTLHQVYLTKSDAVTRAKSLLANLFKEPFWDDTKKQSEKSQYFFKEKNICGSSLAEACERDGTIVSFANVDFCASPIFVSKDGDSIEIDNLFKSGLLPDLLKRKALISLEEYCSLKYNGKSKLDFSKIDKKNGFNSLGRADENEFLNSFDFFCGMSWQEIITSDSLDYKEYHDQSIFWNAKQKVFKFRITKKYRCFGYREGDVFFVLMFDLTHKLSD